MSSGRDRSESPRGERQAPRPRGRLPEATRAVDGVVVNAYSEGWLKRGFPWVYHEEVVGRTASIVPGQVVSIRSRSGEHLGVGVWDEGKVEVRRFRLDDGPIDVDLLRERVRAARVRRAMAPDTTAWRWVHGENDDLPGVRVDVWGDHLSLVLDSPSLRGLLKPLISVLTEEMDLRSVWLNWRQRDEDDEEPAAVGAPPPQGLAWGEDRREDVIVTEAGVKVAVRPWEGHDAGLYCDMRDVRAWLAPHWRGRTVLNTFAYTGMFSLAAARGGASSVTSVDLSDKYLERAKQNFRLNGLDPDAHNFEARDTFKALDLFRRRGDRFDFIIADPPSFSHGPEGMWSSKKDLPRLVAACVRVLEPGGWMLIASNQGKVSPKDFQKQVQAGAQKLGRPLRLIHQGSQPMDFLASLDFPESRYLKCWILQA